MPVEITETALSDMKPRDIAGVAERRSNLAYAEFERDYLYANKPVVVMDALSRWPALSRWSPEFFKEQFGEMKFSIDQNKKEYPSGVEKETVEYTMAGFIDRVLTSTDENPAPYFRNRRLSKLFPSLQQDIQPLPQYFFPNWLPEPFLVSRVQSEFNLGASIELYIGGKGGAFPILHYDNWATHAFLMQIYGRKEFVLFSPDQGRYLYPSSERQNLSLVDSVDHPDLLKYPLFANATATRFVLEPGELVFIPSHWWHTTKMLTPSISISINTVNQSNWSDLVEFASTSRKNALVSIATRTYLNSAGYWRSMRDRRAGMGLSAS